MPIKKEMFDFKNIKDSEHDEVQIHNNVMSFNIKSPEPELKGDLSI